MFRFLTVAIVALSANALSLQEGDLGECDLLTGKCVSAKDVESINGVVLKAPDTMDLPAEIPSCGDTIVDEMVEDKITRNEGRRDRRKERKMRKAERLRLIGLSQPAYETK